MGRYLYDILYTVKILNNYLLPYVIKKNNVYCMGDPFFICKNVSFLAMTVFDIQPNDRQIDNGSLVKETFIFTF